MARHRALIRAAGRRVARWPLVAIGTLLVLLVAWLGWRHADVMMQRHAAVQAPSCPEGELTIAVAVTPSIAEVIGRAANTWTKSRPVVQDHCVRAEVTAMAPQTVLDGLAGRWDAAAAGRRPAAWLPDSSLWVDRLVVQYPDLVGSQPAPIAISPVVLAMPEQAAAAFGTGHVRWSQLPALVTAADGWSRYGHPEWGRFTLAMPDPGRNSASSLALQAVLAGGVAQSISLNGPSRLTPDELSTPEATAAIRALADTVPPTVPASTDAALSGLAGISDISSAPYDAVPTLEYDLYRRNIGADGRPAPHRPLAGVPMAGPTPVADFPFVALAGHGKDAVAVRAAQLFRELLLSSSQQLELAKAGLRANGSKVRPVPAPGIRWADPTPALDAAEAATVEQLAAVWSNAVSRN